MRPAHGRTDPAEQASVEWSLLEGSAIIATIVLSPDGRVVRSNARMRELLEVGTAERLSGRPFAEFLSQPDEWARWVVQRAGDAGAVLRLRSATGAVVTLRGDVRKLANSASCGVFVNASEEAQLRAAVQHGARMEALGSLTTGIAHDFNNLLTVLVGNLYLVAEELRDRPKVFEKIKSARDASKRGADLIKQLLAFARREPLETTVIDPCKVVADLEPLLRRALGSKVALRVELQPEAGRVRASTAQLESVIVNLAINARDAIEKKGTVTVAVQRVRLTPSDAALRGLAKAGDYVAVRVADDGSGIPAETLGKVFEPFFSTKRDRGGTGLGLSMVRWFAEQAGGVVALDSAVGRGTTVALLLPPSVEQVVEQADKTMPLSTLPTGNERVVVLAPDEAVRATVHQILQVLGYEVELTGADEELLEALAAKRADLLIVDGPARDDAGFLARVRNANPAMKVVVTAEGPRSRDRSSSSAGVSVLAKPFSLAELAGAVRQSLDARGDAAARS
jgi:signal transduction histidine kinase/CheY-like chemotaxis protein